MFNSEEPINPTSYYSYLDANGRVELGWLMSTPRTLTEFKGEGIKEELLDSINDLMLFIAEDSDTQDIDTEYLTTENVDVNIVLSPLIDIENGLLPIFPDTMTFSKLRDMILSNQDEDGPVRSKPVINVHLVPNRSGHFKWITDHAGNCEDF